MTRVVIPLDNENGQPASIRFIDGHETLADRRRIAAFIVSQRERPAVGAKFWRGIRSAMLPSLILWLCLAALFAWSLWG